MKNKFFDKIKEAKIERTVEDVYNEGINLYFPTDKGIEYPFACDGFVDTKTDNDKVLKLIIEYKFNEMMFNTVSRAKILVQVIYYIKKFEQNGMILPNVCMVGDKDECFVMHTNELLKYLDENVDWSISPSNAATANPDLVLKISQDANINPFIFEIDENFNFKLVAEKIKDLAENIQRYVRVTEHNLSKIFDYFCKNVLKGKTKLSGHDMVEIFMGVIGDKMNYFQHPSNPNILVCKGRNVNINGNAFKSFFGYFDRNYTPQETMCLNGIADRLIVDADRRNSGDFWTPTMFVDYAHDMISKKLGEDWKEKYVVWDNCCGSLNLTRDYKFGELYCSTLYQSELNIGADYNPEATKFQFDFLNDEIVSKNSLLGVYNDKLPKGLKDALINNKPIVFFINPPYATANVMSTDEKHKAGVAKTMINEQMLKDKIGASSQNLYAQFLYRIIQIKNEFNLTNCHIALFSPTLFLTGSSYAKFRNVFLNEFSFDNAIQFKASHFADVADNWGISFSIWHNGETFEKNNFNYTLIDNENGEIVEIGNKVVYNIDGLKTANDWCKEPIKGLKSKDAPQISSAVKVKDNGRGTIVPNAIGYFGSNSNNVDMNMQFVAMYSSCSSRSHGYSITADNFDRCTALFSARKLIEKNWVNSKDEYLAPNTEHPAYNEFVNDSLIYSLFHSSSNQSSLRNVDYKGKKWDIKNEFFWLSNKEIENLSNTNGFTQTYNDARTSKERYVYNKLQTITLSDEAQAVLDKASDIVRNTFKYRELFNQEHPEYQIMNFDCGWYQIKALAKEYAKSDYEEFVKLFKELENKMRPMVYTLGFLK